MADFDAETNTWLIVYTPRDDSFSLITEAKAVFDKEHLQLEDKLKFFFNNDEWEGVVKGIGGDDDYEFLKTRMNHLNAERRKKEDSFHDEKPRKAVLKNKYLTAIGAKGRAAKLSPDATPSVKSRSNKAEDKSSKRSKESPLSKILKEVENSSSSESESDLKSSPASSPIPEDISSLEKKEANQVKRKSKEQDLTMLKKMKSNANENNGKHETKTDPTKNSISDLPSEELTDKEPMDVTRSKKTSDGSSKKPSELLKRKSIIGAGAPVNIYEDSDEDVEEAEKKDDKKDKKRSKKTMKHEKAEKTEEEKDKSNQTESAERDSVLRWKEGDQDVVLIRGRSKDLADKQFYVSIKDLSAAKSKDNATTFAKSLLVAAFTDSALYSHSVSGGQYRAGGKANITQKPALPADVIAVIADVALHRQSVKKWNRLQTKKEIISQLRQKLVDIRPRLKKQLGIE